MNNEEIKSDLKLIKHLLEKLNEKKAYVIPDDCIYFTTDQVYEIYHINKDTLIKERKAGKILGKRLSNGKWLYPKSQFVFKADKK